MNALLGLVRLDGARVTRAELDVMADAMTPWGYEVGPAWCGDSAAIAGDAIAVEGGSALVFAVGRLDNRNDLSAALDLATARRNGISNAELIALAYERWGLESPRRILGDWSFAAYHPAERRLVLARDHYGHTGLCYRRDGPTLTFASSLKALLAITPSPRLNELRLGQHLVGWPADGAATLYEGIFRLPPAHVLTADPKGLATREYWHPRDAPDVRFRDDDEYVERLVELLAEAVRVRLPVATVASTQSAGLDSSAVTGLAATEQLARGRRLTALTAVPAHPEIIGAIPQLVDEWPLAALALRDRPNVDHLRIDGASISPIEAIARSHAVHDEIEWGVANLPWIWQILETCRSRHECVLLIGQAGNPAASAFGDEEIALGRLRAGDPVGAARAFGERRAGPGGTWTLAVRREIAGPARRRLVRATERLTRGRTPAGSLIAPEFARRLDLRARMRDAGFDPALARATARERRLAALLPGIHPVGAQWAEKGRAYGLDVRDPTADVRVLEFCFGLPNDQLVRGDQNRWLMRRALRGIVPDEVRLNDRRALQGVDIGLRLRADSPAVTAALGRVTSSDLVRETLDVGALRDSWEGLRRAPTARVDQSMGFARGLALGLLLLRFEEGGSARVTP